MQHPAKRLATVLLQVAVFTAGTHSVSAAKDDSLEEGRRLFDEETFGGNGRTCVTCHSAETGTISVEDVAARLAKNDGDPLFRHDGLDDGFTPGATSRIAEHATIRVELQLPPGVTLKDDPNQTSIVVNRGVPATMNEPALGPFFQYDGRFATLEQQAHGALQGHAEVFDVPIDDDRLALLAEFQRVDKRFFSSNKIRKFAEGKKPPELPKGETASEIRGRAMFDNVEVDRETKAGVCAICHSGPMLNQFNEFNPFGAPPGGKVSDIGVAVRNLPGNPVYTFLVKDDPEDASEDPVEVKSPDPGVLLHPNRSMLGLPPIGVPIFPREAFANFVKIPQLWGVARTAPYFHNNAAKTLEEVAEQYEWFFANSVALDHLEFTAQDQADMVAFLKLLDGEPEVE